MEEHSEPLKCQVAVEVSARFVAIGFSGPRPKPRAEFNTLNSALSCKLYLVSTTALRPEPCAPYPAETHRVPESLNMKQHEQDRVLGWTVQPRETQRTTFGSTQVPLEPDVEARAQV